MKEGWGLGGQAELSWSSARGGNLVSAGAPQTCLKHLPKTYKNSPSTDILFQMAKKSTNTAAFRMKFIVFFFPRIGLTCSHGCKREEKAKQRNIEVRT